MVLSVMTSEPNRSVDEVVHQKAHEPSADDEIVASFGKMLVNFLVAKVQLASASFERQAYGNVLGLVLGKIPATGPSSKPDKPKLQVTSKAINAVPVTTDACVGTTPEKKPRKQRTTEKCAQTELSGDVVSASYLDSTVPNFIEALAEEKLKEKVKLEDPSSPDWKSRAMEEIVRGVKLERLPRGSRRRRTVSSASSRSSRSSRKDKPAELYEVETSFKLNFEEVPDGMEPEDPREKEGVSYSNEDPMVLRLPAFVEIPSKKRRVSKKTSSSKDKKKSNQTSILSPESSEPRVKVNSRKVADEDKSHLKQKERMKRVFGASDGKNTPDLAVRGNGDGKENPRTSPIAAVGLKMAETAQSPKEVKEDEQNPSYDPQDVPFSIDGDWNDSDEENHPSSPVSRRSPSLKNLRDRSTDNLDGLALDRVRPTPKRRRLDTKTVTVEHPGGKNDADREPSPVPPPPPSLKEVTSTGRTVFSKKPLPQSPNSPSVPKSSKIEGFAGNLLHNRELSPVPPPPPSLRAIIIRTITPEVPFANPFAPETCSPSKPNQKKTHLSPASEGNDRVEPDDLLSDGDEAVFFTPGTSPASPISRRLVKNPSPPPPKEKALWRKFSEEMEMAEDVSCRGRIGSENATSEEDDGWVTMDEASSPKDDQEAKV